MIFTLQGFNSLRRDGVELTTAFTATVNADLRVGSLQEMVTVTGETPVVDTQNVIRKSTTSREVMDVLPTDRNFVSFATLIPAVLETHFNLAVLFGPVNRIDAAIAHLRLAIEINPRNADAHRNLAVGLGLQGKLEEAIRHDRTSLRLQPGSAATRDHLNALLKASGKPVSP